MTGTRALDAGKNQPFVWDGKDASGLQWPDGNYKISITAKDANGQSVAIPTEIQAVVDSADLTQIAAGAVDRRQGLHARQDQARHPQLTQLSAVTLRSFLAARAGATSYPAQIPYKMRLRG